MTMLSQALWLLRTAGVVADAAGSVGVIVLGAHIAITDQGVWDVVIALLIAVFVIVRAVTIGRQVPTGARPARTRGHRPRGGRRLAQRHRGCFPGARPARTGSDVGDGRGDGTPRRCDAADHHDVLDGARHVTAASDLRARLQAARCGHRTALLPASWLSPGE